MNPFSACQTSHCFAHAKLQCPTSANQTVLHCTSALRFTRLPLCLAIGGKPVLPEPARSSLERHWSIHRPNIFQAQASRLSSASFPFSVCQPDSMGLRLPAFQAIPLRRLMRPCGFVEPLLFARIRPWRSLRPRAAWVMRRRPLSRQRSATFGGEHRSGRSDRLPLLDQASFRI